MTHERMIAGAGVEVLIHTYIYVYGVNMPGTALLFTR